MPLLDDDVADVLVRVRGSSACSGTPIAGTRLVVTAAHCVLDGAGDVTAVTVVRDGVEHRHGRSLSTPGTHDAPSPHLDAAVLVHGPDHPGSRLRRSGTPCPLTGLVTLAGFQPIDTDGTLLRGTSYHDRPTPKGVTGGVVEIESLPSGCVDRASSIEVAGDQLKLGCGLIPGASGGGLFAKQGGKLVLLGIISTVGRDLSYNELTPLTALRELLDHPDEYTHALPDERPLTPRPTTARQ